MSGGNDRPLISEQAPAPDRKPWAEVTDDEVVAAARLAVEHYGGSTGIVGSGHVLQMLTAPTRENWPGGCPPNATPGLGILVRFGEGSASGGQIAARLRKLAKAGRLERVALRGTYGGPAGPGYRLPR